MLKLLRAKQWYKNLVVFLPLVFAGVMFDYFSFITAVFAFVSLCLVSSASYIINDLKDVVEDRWHPEKSLRPIASGKVKPGEALGVALILFVGAMLIAGRLSLEFSYCVLGLFLLTQVYTFFLKKEMFADLILISTNFVIRAVAGALVISVRVSPWLILCTFFLSMFLVSVKRKGNLGLVKNNYTLEIVDRSITVSTVCLLISYSLYSFLSIYPMLIVTLPLAIYVVFSYIHLSDVKKVLGRNPEKVFKEFKIVLGASLWMITAFVIVYFNFSLF